MAWWTGSHFTPVSLYSLGFVLPLGHHGDPCPLKVEVQSQPSPFCSLTYQIFRVLKLLRTVSPHSRSLSTLVVNLSNQSVKRGPCQQRGCRFKHRYPQWMGRTQKDHATLYLRPHLMSPPEAPKGCTQQSQVIHWSVWSTNLGCLTWSSYTAYATTQWLGMSNWSILGCFLQATSKLKLPSLSQCWMTSWQIIWSVRPQHSNTTQSFKA